MRASSRRHALTRSGSVVAVVATAAVLAAGGPTAASCAGPPSTSVYAFSGTVVASSGTCGWLGWLRTAAGM